jgi:hypothetical protein
MDRWHQLADAIQASNLPPSDRSVFRCLLDASDYATGELPPKFTPKEVEIAKRTGHSLRQVKYSISHLRRHGWDEGEPGSGRGHRSRYALAIGSRCDCEGRRHLQEKVQREPLKGAVVAPEKVQPKGATPQVERTFPLRGNERRKGEEMSRRDRTGEPIDDDAPDFLTSLPEITPPPAPPSPHDPDPPLCCAEWLGRDIGDCGQPTRRRGLDGRPYCHDHIRDRDVA